MSTSAVRTEAPTGGLRLATQSLPARLISTFSGTVGLVVKIALLSLVNALSVWAGVILAQEESWRAVGILAVATIAIDVVYLWPRRLVPLKFLIPGTVFLIAFQIVPIAYNVNIAFTNWSTGHVLTKAEAIDAIAVQSLAPPADGKSYVMAPARDEDGEIVLVLVDEASGETFVGTREGLEPIPQESVQLTDVGTIASAEGYELVQGPELLTLDRLLQGFTVPTQGNAAIRPEGLEVALELEPTLRYDAAGNTYVRIADNTVFSDNGRGSFVAANGEELEPGWRVGVGSGNFSRILRDPLIRGPFLRVFVWTFAFAFLTVMLSFALGLFLAIALDKPGLRFRRLYRSTLVIPYAIPGFLSLLVWQGLLNDDFGIVNQLLPFDVPWLFDANWAKVSVVLVSVWLTFPYFFLVSMGALQSIPSELIEAAKVDGGGAMQIFRRVTLPLLLVAVAPLMIASFAFNFNNFGNIYILTGGGPAAEDGSVAGGTDILISYTYKLAFEAGKGNDYGLAAAVSIVIFFIIATISAVAFWRTRGLENLR